MRRLAAPNRSLTIAFAIVQMVLPGVVSIADAGLERESARAVVVHVEDHSTAHCARVHTEDCLLCRTITGNAAAARPLPLPPAIQRTAGAWPEPPRLERRVAAHHHPPSRAPPAMVAGLA